MMKSVYDLTVIGAGPAGLAAAYEAWNKGIKEILLIERANETGGILNQCIHNGFGLHYFKEELTGPEYAERFGEMVKSTGIKLLSGTMVLDIEDCAELKNDTDFKTSNARGANGGDCKTGMDSKTTSVENSKDYKTLHIVNPTDGYCEIKTRSLILAMGCRERSRGAIGIPGTRPAGIFTAGTAQRLINCEGLMPGKKVVILGSGDIGLIMARRLTLSGAKVLACVELMPFSSGLTRNIVQCLEDFNIPLYLSHTITNIIGKNRVEKVIVSKVDENRKPVPGSEIEFDCDTVLLSVGLLPENELTKNAGIKIDRRTKGPFVFENRETLAPGVFACGNVVHVHDLVDNVTKESQIAGRGAAEYILSKNAQSQILGSANRISNFASSSDNAILVSTDENVSYTVPQYIHKNTKEKVITIFFRVRKVYKTDSVIAVYKSDGKTKTKIASFKREHMAPGEMEQINIAVSQLSQEGSGDLDTHKTSDKQSRQELIIAIEAPEEQK